MSRPDEYPDILKTKDDKKLIEWYKSHVPHRSGNQTLENQREMVKAELDFRGTQKMFELTNKIRYLTWALLAVTVVLLFKN